MGTGFLWFAEEWGGFAGPFGLPSGARLQGPELSTAHTFCTRRRKVWSFPVLRSSFFWTFGGCPYFVQRCHQCARWGWSVQKYALLVTEQRPNFVVLKFPFKQTGTSTTTLQLFCRDTGWPGWPTHTPPNATCTWRTVEVRQPLKGLSIVSQKSAPCVWENSTQAHGSGLAWRNTVYVNETCEIYFTCRLDTGSGCSPAGFPWGSRA